jgi:membrane protein DedA with SNARE-associated domain
VFLLPSNESSRTPEADATHGALPTTMSLEALIQSHGYWIVFLGTFFEGETILILGGIAAHSGYLKLVYVMLAAFAGSTLCDQTFFYLGRRHGAAVLARRPGWRAGIERVDAILTRHDALMIMGFRFLYGLRTVAPFAIGMSSGISIRRFAAFNLLGAAIWAIAFGLAGYVLGNAVEAFVGRSRRYELILLASVTGVGLVLALVRIVRRRRRRQAQPPPPTHEGLEA